MGQQGNGEEMAGVTFGSGWTGSGDNGFSVSISGDSLAFTITFAEIEATVDAGKSDDLVAARVFSAVMPLEGDGDEVSIAFTASVYAFASEGATGYALLSVNGQTAIQQFAAGTDDDFVQPLTVTAGPGSLLHLVVVAVAQRDPAYPDAAAAVRPVSIDAEIPLPS
jgi:hypothetical protein